MNSDDPIAFFITWTVYGTYLQGDNRGWRLRRKGPQPPQPRLVQWHRERLKHDVLLLSTSQRMVVQQECQRHAIIVVGSCGRRAPVPIMCMLS